MDTGLWDVLLDALDEAIPQALKVQTELWPVAILSCGLMPHVFFVVLRMHQFIGCDGPDLNVDEGS